MAQAGSRNALALPEPAADLMCVLLLKWRRENCVSHHKTLKEMENDGEETLETEKGDNARFKPRNSTKNHRKEKEIRMYENRKNK
jgi:hypothetical protein